ncbi:MAG TPA: hypothetical protein VIW25_12670 [Nitrososphaeraceae archaeon]
MERMHSKEGLIIVAVSTPGLYMDDEMYEILNDPMAPYHKCNMDYHVTLDAGLYTKEEIEIAKKSSSFEREFSLRWGSGTRAPSSNHRLSKTCLQTVWIMTQTIPQYGRMILSNQFLRLQEWISDMEAVPIQPLL